MPLDYSKWKDIEVSDDEDDTHPNVDTPSLYRWRHQARMERMAEKKQKKDEIEEKKNDYEKKMAELKRRLDSVDLSGEEQSKRQRVLLQEEMSECERQHKHWLEKEEELAKQEDMEKWNVDTISHDKWTTTRINKVSDKSSSSAKDKMSEEDENKLMREFFKTNEKEIATFAKLQTFDASRAYLNEHPRLCCEWTANHMTLDALNAGITEKEHRLNIIARQVVTLQYLLELASSLKANPQSPSLIDGFFRKIAAAEDTYMKMFNSEVEAFIARVHARAAQKREEAMKEAEEEERLERIKNSPGGLDPLEVMASLPAAMREAFESQEVSRLQDVATTMDMKVFQDHLDRCIKSGLWLADGGKQQERENGDHNGNADES